jgi:large subunit ribosomal protein L6
MSRVGEMPIKIPDGVEVKIGSPDVIVKGPKGTLSCIIHSDIKIKDVDGELIFERPSDNKIHKSLHGSNRSMLNNMILGVVNGFSKGLEIVGVGYRAEQSGKDVTLHVMYSHPVKFNAPNGIEFKVEGNNLLTVFGIDKQLVGHIAAQIRKVRPPNPYTGKGIRYRGEQVKIKPGKSARSVV